jgi:hypothetical protein
MTKAASLLLSLFLFSTDGRAFAQDADPVSLLPNGGFDQANPTNAAIPLGWDRLDGLGVTWEAGEAGDRFIRMNTAVSEKDYVESCRANGLDKWVFPNAGGGPIAGTYGLSYYSDSIPVSTGQAYRLTFRFRGGGKVWVRGYGQLRNEERRLYDTVVNCRGTEKGWNTLSQCFHPTKHTPGVRTIRIMLYAYWPPGLYDFDEVALTPVSEAEWQACHRENE